jgi:WhiB family redox-sensing transcriptional regulator
VTTPPCAADPETWFPNPQDQETTDHAIATCRSCPLVEPCLEVALRAEGTYGTWARYGIYGGLTPGHRATLARRRARRRKASA